MATTFTILDKTGKISLARMNDNLYFFDRMELDMHLHFSYGVHSIKLSIRSIIVRRSSMFVW